MFHVNCKFDSHFRLFVGNLIPAYRGARRRHKFHVLIEVIQSNIALKNIFHFVNFVQITFQKWVLNNILQFIRLLFRKNTEWNPLSNKYFRSVFFGNIMKNRIFQNRLKSYCAGWVGGSRRLTCFLDGLLFFKLITFAVLRVSTNFCFSSLEID